MRRPLSRFRDAIAAEPRSAGHAELFPLEYPLFPVPRIAVLGAEVRPEPGVLCFPKWTACQLSALRPRALAGSWREISNAGRMASLGMLELPDLCYPVIVFSDPSVAPLHERQHAMLWDWFGLPAYEQIRTASGRLLAYECDARDGFHMAPGIDPSEFGGIIETRPCPCGASEPLVRMASARRALVAAGT